MVVRQHPSTGGLKVYLGDPHVFVVFPDELRDRTGAVEIPIGTVRECLPINGFVQVDPAHLDAVRGDEWVDCHHTQPNQITRFAGL